MRTKSFARVGLAGVLLIAAAACSDSTAPGTVPDTTLTADLAEVSGDAIATDVADLVGNELFGAAVAGASAYATAAVQESGITRNRTKTCYNASDVVVECGQGQTASMVITLQMDGSVSGDHFTAVVHRARHDSIAGFGDQATQRTHNGFGSGSDTTTFTRDAITRTAATASTDTVKNIVFNLPHANNPWPVSGQIIRNVNATFTFTGARDVTRTVVRRVVVTFPADAQGNVSLQVGSLNCTLNLVTHAVNNCSSAG